MMRSISSAETALGSTECRQVRTEGTAPMSPAGMTPVLVRKRRNARISRNGLPATDRLKFGSFASNEINDGVRAELLPFDLGMTKTLIQEPTSVEEVITTTSRSTA